MPRQKHYYGENHLHFLTTSIYPYNGEGRVTHSSSSGQWRVAQISIFDVCVSAKLSGLEWRGKAIMNSEL